MGMRYAGERVVESTCAVQKKARGNSKGMQRNAHTLRRQRQAGVRRRAAGKAVARGRRRVVCALRGIQPPRARRVAARQHAQRALCHKPTMYNGAESKKEREMKT